MHRIETRFLIFTCFMAVLGGAIGYATRCRSDACLLDPNTAIVATGEGSAAGAGAAIAVSLKALFSTNETDKRKRP